jgi:hypothetical protein
MLLFAINQEKQNRYGDCFFLCLTKIHLIGAKNEKTSIKYYLFKNI